MTSVLLNNVDHQQLRVIARHGPEYGDAINQALIFPGEFQDVQREYPILFRRSSTGEFQAVALLGLDKGENLFLGEGRWNARYIPAVQQRGPFAIAVQERMIDGRPAAERVLVIDPDHPRVSTSEGEPLFRPHGGNAPYLDHVTRVMRTIHDGIEASRAMFALFEQMELIEPATIDIHLNDDERYTLSNHYTVGEDRIASLKGADLERLQQAGFLPHLFFVPASLGNVARLIELKNRRRDAA
jgi:hypothetical protein